MIFGESPNIQFILNTSFFHVQIFFQKSLGKTHLTFGRYFKLFDKVSTISVFRCIKTASEFLEEFLIIAYITVHC